MYTSTPHDTTPAGIHLHQGDASDIASALPLLAAYRAFYELPTDAAALATYLQARLSTGEATLWLASQAGQPVAVALCYRGYSTLSLARNDLLHDLYVAPAWRRHGIAAALLRAIQQSIPPGGSLWLETAHSNHGAQALYLDMGFVPDTVFLTMSWQCPADL
ncbi:GNAT family N-acetyltransferase [Vogesella sp. DC21W]|uniref:GNAT family N-acetyltransferase n=1 Tax=Vogesella aquatica TaxID=2984206 RepID=A0ABT5J455_9NEIS|nr:GNAT family N-acetyltransferase [Vogesella aquatica]MDC7718804.1 GNAT family N-acetyltransferase [Vogesella aquatica]